MTDVLHVATSILSLATGDEELEVFVIDGVDTNVRAYQGEVENLTTAVGSGVGVRVLRNGVSGAQVGSAWAGSLDDDSIAEVLREARENLRFATEDEFVAFATPDGVAPASLSLASDDVRTVTIDEKIALAIELERAVRSADPRIRQVEAADYSDYVVRSAIASSRGIAVTSERSGAYLSVEAIAADATGDRTGWGLTAGRSPRDLDVNKARDDAVNRATRMLGATKPASSKGVAVFDPRTAATLLSIVGSGLSGEAVVRGRSLFAGRLGETVAASSFTLVDDPTDPRHFSAAVFDGEGIACRRNALIDRGQLVSFVYDTTSGRRAGTASTGSASRGGLAGSPTASCRALQLEPGSQDQSEILRQVDHGVFVESLTGVHSGVNPISGDFSVGITGLMIRDGQLAEPIREATVASSLQRMLLDVVAVGSDQEWLPGVAAGQTLAIDNVALSGS
jgi:PmbA protein